MSREEESTENHDKIQIASACLGVKDIMAGIGKLVK
jgi:hypothetical protein